MKSREEKASFRRAMGARMRESARSLGWTSDTLAEELSVEGGTVRGWWVGRTSPSVENLARYAELAKVSVQYLLGGSDEPMGESGTIQEWRLRFAELISQGVEPLEAIDRITGTSRVGDPGIPAERLTPEERELLQGAGPAMRAVLEEASGGAWDRLDEPQKEAVLRLIEAMARSPRDEPG